jgi:hypothetical protein
MQTVKNWCDGERVKKLGTLRQTKQGLNKVIPLRTKFHKKKFKGYCFWCYITSGNQGKDSTQFCSQADELNTKLDNFGHNLIIPCLDQKTFHEKLQ